MHGTSSLPHKELEVKLELASADLRTLNKVPLLRAAKAKPTRSTEVTLYFDTDKHKLRQHGLMLRVRRQGRRYTQTIKATANSGVFRRDEWESEIAGTEPDLDKAAGTALEPFLNGKLRHRLKPLFETRVRRTIYPALGDRHAIAVSVDQGTIETGKRSQALCEVELELQRGTAADLFDAARGISQAIPARLGIKSKSERGYEIVGGAPDLPAKAAPIDLPAAASARDAFRAIGLDCLKQIVANEPALAKGDAEGVHQMRVGLRRLRAAMSLFVALLGDPQSDAIKSQLKWLAEELGPARELEVLLNRVIAPIRRSHKHWRGMPSLCRELAGRRDDAVARAQEAVKSVRFRALTIDIAAWLEAGLWSDPRDDLVTERGNLSAEAFASDQLARRWRKVRKKGKMLGRLDARRRHKLRIQTKKLRYAAEFFASLFTAKQALKRHKKFVRALERLQDALGDVHDIDVHEKRITAVGNHHWRADPNRVFAAGLLAGREDARLEAALAAATDAYDELAKLKLFWH